MYKYIPLKHSFGWIDICVLAAIAAVLYALIGFAHEWTGHLQLQATIDLSPRALPKYAALSLIRAWIAYFFSLSFTLTYGYIAAKSKKFEQLLIPLLDILQSIPVLGFLPGLVLGLVALFPHSNLGLELACILMIFTGQAWNMTFSFYSSLKSIPSDFHEVSQMTGLSLWQKFKTIELPFSAIGLAWNSLMSMAGGWFFLATCESIAFGDKKFQLPGIGAYMATAAEENNSRAMLYGILAMCFLILFTDFIIWRPIMAWVRKFQMEGTQEDIVEMPLVTTLLRESWIIKQVSFYLKRRRHYQRIKKAAKNSNGDKKIFLTPLLTVFSKKELSYRISKHKSVILNTLEQLLIPFSILICFWGGTRVWEMIRTLTSHDWSTIWMSVGLTFLRVCGSIMLGSLWAIPVGIIIGLSPRLTRFFQPLIQVAASFPAPMLYPIALLLMQKIGLTINWGSMFLMLLGVQWYVLFNVLAGAMGITRDLKDGIAMIGVSRWTKWHTLYLPSVFPALVTGWITAAGGAWNASIVAEYIQRGSYTLVAPGIGSLISQATANANFPLLAGCLLAMVITVVGLNRSVWRKIYEIAETKFRFER